ncbi:MAG: M1 family metallopeptidase [Ferruginibacter sp.]
MQVPAFCQDSAYWQQQVNYKIKVSLDTAAGSLTGNVKMQYYNNSPDTLYFIWIHLWPNAYKNDRTAFSEQQLEMSSTSFYFSTEKQRGYINRLDFKVNDISAATEDHPLHQDIVKLILPAALAPQKNISIETPFHVKLPAQFSRSGIIKKSYQLTQWYPKPAVYDQKGWHPMPYLDMGEFYSEFGNFNVEINTPAGFKIAATGNKLQENENAGIQTSVYQLNNIHDFAWFASKDYIIKHDTLQLSSKTIDVYACYYKENEKQWKNSIRFIKDAILTKSRWLGEYPYSTVTVVDKKGKEDGGMEYPTITLVSTPATEKGLDFLIYHEVGHNWFYGILASNERQHPWMDEGMNTYYDNRYMQEKYGEPFDYLEIKSAFLKKRLPADLFSTGLDMMTVIKKDQPVETPSENFSAVNYNIIAYGKTGKWMKMLEAELGQPLFDSCMRAYYETWKFRHPYPEDFKMAMEKASGKHLDAQFALLTKTGSLEQPAKKKLKLASFFSFKDTDKYNYIFAAPAVGYNKYDKLMPGILLHNYTIPASRLQFAGTVLYGTGSKHLNSTGNISYSWFPGNIFEKISVGTGWSKFSSKQSLDTTSKKIVESFSKLAPSLRFYFLQKPRSAKRTWIELKSFVINEKKFDNYVFITGSDSSSTYPSSFRQEGRYIYQISFSNENYRALYPYSYQFQLQQGKGFYRLNATANYFFNYSKGGGLSARIFAAKFGLLGNSNNTSYLYQPKLLGGTGEDDYSYSSYFLGRSASTANPDLPVANKGLAAQQVMIQNTGGLKLRMDKYSFLQGQSPNWVAALNLKTSLPEKLFPVKLPLYLFFDIGTYAEAWGKNAFTTRFLYTGGLQISLFKNVLNIYAPVLMSKDFKNTLKSDPDQNRFAKKMTFSIDLQNLSARRLIPQIPF